MGNIVGMLVVASIIGSVIYVANDAMLGDDNPGSRTALKMAMTVARSSAECGQGDSLVDGTPKTIARRLVATLNKRLEQAADQRSDGGLPPAFDIQYAVGFPTEEWQVVIAGDDEEGTIWIEGYGSELDEPLLWEELPCKA